MATTSIYHRTLKEKLDTELNIALAARKKGLDPAPTYEINITKDLAERVEALIGVKGLGARIRELEQAGNSREELALKIGYDFVENKFGEYRRIEIVELAVRTAVAILTEGVVAAPIEGISRVESDRNDDGSEYIKVFYSGPIRSAGGTAQALSVLAADYIRRRMGFAAYQPRENEIGRYVLEVSVYERITGLQYKPTDEEIKEIVRSCPICIDGDATEDMEVGGFKDLQRVATNKIRGGMVLVLIEGIAMKATKIKRHVDRLGLEGWELLAKLVKSKGEKKKKKFLGDLIAGRPVFGRPSAKGSFSLRYGRSRNTGLETVGLNPYTMSLLGFVAAGTQIKPELPGKASCVVPVDTIDAATVKLKDGSLVRLDSAETVTKLRDEVAEIVDVGEILIDYGDFLETGHRLMPGAYSHEWWLRELEAKSNEESAKWCLKPPNQAEAIELAYRFDLPLHPAYTYLWADITEEDKAYLADFICEKGTLEENTLFIHTDDGGRVKAILEDLLVLHHIENGSIAIDGPDALLRSIGITGDLRRDESTRVKTRNKAPTRIGVRMGRPEKSKERRMAPAPHSIFPVGEYGGKSRLLKEALKKKVIEVEIGMRRCNECGNEFISSSCICDKCGSSNFKTPGLMQDARSRLKTGSRAKRSIDLWNYYHATIKKLGELPNKQNVKCVQGLISKHKVAENLGKGILRAKHGVIVFKDGTIRYDFTNLPLTHFKPKEIGLSIEKAKELGYSHDTFGKELVNETQVIELKQQDIVISLDAASYLLKVSQFMDSLLSKFYGLSPYYGASSKEDLLGELVLGLAPHTSAGILGRIIGFTKASACYAHPFFHAAKRRNCLHPKEKVVVKDIEGIRLLEIEELVEKYKPDDIEVVHYENGKLRWKKPIDFVKMRAPKKLLRIRTEYGREIVVTPDHKFLVFHALGKQSASQHTSKNSLTKSDAQASQVEAEKLKIGDITAAASIIPSEGEITEIVVLNSKIPLDADLGFLVGLYLAKGYARGGGTRSRVWIDELSMEVAELVVETAKSVFGYKPSLQEDPDAYVVTMGKKLIYDLFVNVLGLGTDKKEKRIPCVAFNNMLFASGIISGLSHGGIESEILISSSNKELINDTIYLMLSLGIFAELGYEYPEYNVRYSGSLVDDLIGNRTQIVKAKDKGRKSIRRIGDATLVTIKEIELIDSDTEWVYDLVIDGNKTFVAGYGGLITVDCDGDEDSVLLLLDALINFSLFFLPEKRGGKMDAPLVLIPFINPKEVDKEARNVSIAREYPLEFYEAACLEKLPKEVDIETAATRIEEPKDIYGFLYTHETTDIAAGPLNSLYKSLGTMMEKLDAQLRLARIIRAVDAPEVAEAVIENHFLRDIKGNLRAFGSQRMRCSKCNAKYRRIPLSGKCTRCGSKILPTVHIASVKKYLDVSLRMAKEYHLSDYTRQRLELLQKDVNALFPDAGKQQKALTDFM